MPTTALVLLTLGLASTQAAPENPLKAAARAIGRHGLEARPAPDRSPTRFASSGSRLFVDRFLSAFVDDPREVDALRDSVTRSLDDYEQAAAGTRAHLDASAALAYAVCVLTSTALGASLDEDAYSALIGRFQATFDTAELRAAGDRHKQELYETALCSVGLMETLTRAVDSPAGRAGLRALARRQLLFLIGADVDRIRLEGARVEILGTEPKPVPPPVPAPVAAGLATAFQFATLPGWSLENGWHFKREDAAGGVETACLRFLPPMPAEASVGTALGNLWKKEIPKELAERFSTAVYRRRVGDGLLSYFLCGTGREAGRKADTLFALQLVVCGAQWQPVVVALTFDPSGETPATPTYAAAAARVEAFLAGFACPPARNRGLASRASLIGDYGFGTRAVLDGVRSGAIDGPAMEVGGTLSLRSDGSYAYAFVGDPAVAESLGVHPADDEGRWSIEDDRLVLAPRSGIRRNYRLAGLTQFTAGPKVAVLLSRTDLPLHPGTLGSRADWFSTKLR